MRKSGTSEIVGQGLINFFSLLNDSEQKVPSAIRVCNWRIQVWRAEGYPENGVSKKVTFKLRPEGCQGVDEGGRSSGIAQGGGNNRVKGYCTVDGTILVQISPPFKKVRHPEAKGTARKELVTAQVKGN